MDFSCIYLQEFVPLAYKNLQNMLGKSPDRTQRDLFRPLLSDFIDMNNELVLLANQIDWEYFEKEFSSLYSPVGKSSVAIRMMVGCLLLKQLYNLGDETLAKEWVRDPYMQYLCGEAYFQHKFPFDPSDFVHFRHRIGEEGFEKIFRQSVLIHGQKNIREKMELSDTTVQGNNITFPTDSKLYKKIIDGCNKISTAHELPVRQSYTRVSKQLLRNCYNSTHPKRRKKADRSRKKLHTIAGRRVRELERHANAELLEKYKSRLELYHRILTQARNDKHKVYSIHKPYTECISKGKAHKQYEFGNKVGILVTYKSLIITAVRTYLDNPHDSRTIDPLVEQLERNKFSKPEEIIYDRGGKGVSEVKGVKISTPGKPLKTATPYQKQKTRKKFRRRAAIEAVIGHLKTQFRMRENYLHGQKYIQINALLSATAWNLKKWMKEAIFWLFKKWQFISLSENTMQLYWTSI